MRFPDVLIIGAMKSGTTTLYRDLAENPAVFFPIDKEPNSLVSDDVLTDEGRAAYAAMFERARPDQICAEASTSYTKNPVFEGAAGRARQLLRPDLKLIYLVREPVARIVSHQHHELTSRKIAERDIDRLVREYPAPLDFCRYAWQAQFWIDAFGPEQLRIVRFEDFIRDRKGVVASLSTFLGIDSRTDLVDPEANYNKSEGKPRARGFLRAVNQSPAYRRVLRPLLSAKVREKIRHRILPKAPPRPDPPSRATIEFIYDTLGDDLEALRVMMGLDEPVWSRERALSKARDA
ncbi:MAG: sulfotransferase [Phycisphaerales bacterium]|nr:sulfotransferase [Phycisphaerales bacterium]